MDYHTYLASEEWQMVRHEALERASRQCQLCPETRYLEVHHRIYARIGRERPSDLVVLCYWCHRKHHGTLASNRFNSQQCTDGQQWLPFEPMIPTDAELN